MKDQAHRARQRMIRLILACMLCVGLGEYVLPQRTDAQQAEPILYTPPPRGVPGGREGAGSRGDWQSLPMLTVLTPKDHMGLTGQEQPILYWYLAQATQHPVDIVLTARQSITPLLDTRLHPPVQPGMQRVRLADYNIHLDPGVSYTWSVSLVPDTTQRSRDVMAAGTIARIALPHELQSQLVQADQRTSARLYATTGLWYDLIATLSELIEADAQDRTLRQQRATLLDQEGLTAAAAYDRQRQ
jgi:hypothetical protein